MANPKEQTLTRNEQERKRQGPSAKIDGKLQSLRGFLRASIWARGLSMLVVALVVLACLSFGIDRAFRLSVPGRAIALALYLGALICVSWRTLIKPALVALTDSTLADLVETRFPELGDSLRSAVSFLAEPRARDAGKALTTLLKREVTKQASEKIGKLNLAEVVDSKRVSEAAVLALCAACLLGAVAHYAGDSFGIWVRRQLLLAETNYEYASELRLPGMKNGEFAVPWGETLRIVAETTPGKKKPAKVSIRFDYPSGEIRHYMKSGGKEGPGRFAYEHPSVTENFFFYLREEGSGFFSNYHSPRYRVRVQKRPEVERLVITRKAPEYTSIEPEDIEGDIGELAIPVGSILGIRGFSNKPLERAVLLVEGKELVLDTVPGNPWEFTGSWEPELGGTCQIRLEDTEGVPPERPFQFSVHMVEDRPPVVQATPTGIGQMITSQARIPLLVKARDDYGIDSMLLRWTLQDSEGAESAAGEPLNVPGVPTREPLAEPVDWDITRFRIKPEKRLNLQVGAVDNDKISGSKTGYSGIMSFLIVTPEKLGDEFLRREIEQRRILERLVAQERVIRDQVYEMVDKTWSKPGEIGRADLRKMQEISRAERQHGRQLESIAAAVEHILVEMENNKIGEADDLKRLAELIIGPLRTLGGEVLPLLATKLNSIRDLPDERVRITAGLELGRAIDTKIQEMENIIVQMRRLEGFTEIVKHLRAIIRTQSESSSETRRAYRSLIDDIFEDDLFEENKRGDNK